MEGAIVKRKNSKVKLDDTGERLIPEKSSESVVYGEHISRYISVSEMVKDKVVLDIASGTGYGSQMLAQDAKNVIGVDVSEEAIMYAKKNYPAKNLKYFVADAEKIDVVKDKSIDVVVSLETIEHLASPEKFMSEVKRVLKEEGLFIVSTPNDAEYREGNDFHLHEFTIDELKKLMAKNFKHTDYYFQGNALAATLFNADNFTGKFQMKMPVQKTISVSTDRAIYFLAVAGNKKSIPKITQNVSLSQHWNTKGFLEWSENQEKAIKDMTKKNERLKKEIESIYLSHSWKLTKPLRKISMILKRSTD